jgi:hypothetical protein
MGKYFRFEAAILKPKNKDFFLGSSFFHGGAKISNPTQVPNSDQILIFKEKKIVKKISCPPSAKNKLN